MKQKVTSGITVFNRVDDMMSQLEKSWPETFKSIMKKNLFPDQDSFFIYTFEKWDYSGPDPVYNIFHQPRKTMPDPFWGTCLRKVYKDGRSEIVWALPHCEGQKNYEPGKMFHDPIVYEYIQKKKSGSLDKMVEDYNSQKFDQVPEKFKMI